jgi:hypothetical protein
MRNLKLLLQSKQSSLFSFIAILSIVTLFLYSNYGIDFDLYKNKNYNFLGIIFLLFLFYWINILAFEE